MFTSKWVICVFSYNRGLLLQNLLESISRFYPEFDIVVFDDNSDESATMELLATIQQKRIQVITSYADGTKSKHGGLYNLMNMAIEFAKNSQYKYVYFVQDDMQFLWRDDDLELHLEKVFNYYSDCIMCNCNFLLKIFKNDTIPKLRAINETGIYSFTKHGVGDTGIIDIERARNINLCFPYQAERENGEYWYNKGYRLYWLSRPNLAWMPWPKVYRFKKSERAQVYSLHLRNYKITERLKINKNYAFLEDYATTNSILLKPYWHGASHGWINMLKIYIKYYLGIRLIQPGKE